MAKAGMDNSATDRHGIADRDISLTFAKGLNVLKVFDNAPSHLTLSQIARLAGLDRATARRLVLTLVHLGYVRQEDRVFSLTPRILVLAGGFLQARRFGKTIEPVIRTFSDRIGEPVSMAMIDGQEAVYVAHAGARPDTVSLGFTIGSRVPLLSTAIGRALIAACPAEQAGDLVRDAPLERFTDRTETDRDSIAADIAETARRGHAFVDGEFEAGVAALAVAVRPRGSDPAALGISGSAARFADTENRARVVDALRECGTVIAGLL